MYRNYRWHWRRDYLVVAPEVWRRERDAPHRSQRYEVLDLWDARRALERIAREDSSFLQELAAVLHYPFPFHRTALGRHDEQHEKARLLCELEKALGTPLSMRGEPPQFARIYICKLKQDTSALHRPEPRRDEPEAGKSARTAQRSHVIVEAVNEAGEPLSKVRFELLLADGKASTCVTDPEGRARLDGIPSGVCRIRVPELDADAWRPAEGAPSVPVGKGDSQLHVVRRGENLSRIAMRYGLRGWQRLWDAPENETLRKRRKSPHVLLPGDRVAIPAIAVHEIVRSTDQTHRIVIADATVKVRLRLQDLAREPFAGLSYDYRYSLGDREIHEPGSSPTDADGWLEESVPITVDTLTVILKKSKLAFTLRLHSLHPAQDADSGAPVPSGVYMRLSSLGYAPGPVAGELSARAKRALAAFQADELERDEPDGHPDEATIAALERSYGV